MDICFLSASEIVDKIKKNEISAVQVAKSLIQRINLLEKKVKAFIYFDKEYFLKKAKDSDDWRLSGKSLGPLHGLPVAIKDIFKTKDMPTYFGTSIRENYLEEEESDVTKLLIKAGAIIMGKTVTTELAYFDAGKTTNPHDYLRTPGGSSSGSAAAVAAYMVPISIGTQTAGSVIRPASYCGITAIKPTYGIISRKGCLQQSFLLDQIGIFSRNIEDLSMCSSILSKDNINNDLKIKEPKFIFLKTSKWDNIEKEAKKLFENFINKISKNIIKIENPKFLEKAYDYQKIIQETDMAHNFSYFYEKYKEKIGKKLIEAINRGLNYKAKEYAIAVENMNLIYNQLTDTLGNFDSIITPATTGFAPKGLDFTGSPEFCSIWTYLGMPTINLPLIQNSERLPLGIQLVGRKYDDKNLLKNANWLFKKHKIN